MRLAFKNWGAGYSYKEVPIKINIGTIEDVGKSFEVEFWKVWEIAKSNAYDFKVELLYQGYLTAHCEAHKRKEIKGFPKYTRTNACIWADPEHLTSKSEKELYEMLQQMIAGLKKVEIKKKVKEAEQPLQNSEVLQSGNLDGPLRDIEAVQSMSSMKP